MARKLFSLFVSVALSHRSTASVISHIQLAVDEENTQKDGLAVIKTLDLGREPEESGERLSRNSPGRGV